MDEAEEDKETAQKAVEAAAVVPWSGHGCGLEHERIAERVQAPDEPPDLHINQEVIQASVTCPSLRQRIELGGNVEGIHHSPGTDLVSFPGRWVGCGKLTRGLSGQQEI